MRAPRFRRRPSQRSETLAATDRIFGILSSLSLRPLLFLRSGACCIGWSRHDDQPVAASQLIPWQARRAVRRAASVPNCAPARLLCAKSVSERRDEVRVLCGSSWQWTETAAAVPHGRGNALLAI